MNLENFQPPTPEKNTMVAFSKKRPENTPLSELMGLEFLDEFSKIVDGSEYYTMLEESDRDITRMIAMARNKGYGGKIDQRDRGAAVKQEDEDVVLPTRPLDIKAMGKSYKHELETNPEFRHANTHPDDVPADGFLGKTYSFPKPDGKK